MVELVWIGLLGSGGSGLSRAGAGAEGWAGRGRWAGPETLALGLALALAWRAAAREPCVGMSQGLPARRSETETVGKISVLWSKLGGGWRGPAQGTKASPPLPNCCLSVQPVHVEGLTARHS